MQEKRPSRVIVLIDELHPGEILAGLARLLPPGEVDLVLAHVHGPDPRGGLELLRRGHAGRGGPRPLPPHRLRELSEAEGHRAASAVDEARRAAEELAWRVTVAELAGEPGHEVCKLADRMGADLVVVRTGGPDRPPIGPRSLGRVARFIADHCPCAVLLLRGGKKM